MKRRGVWLLLAAALLALSALLMSRGDKDKSTVKPPKIVFPRGASVGESARNQQRRTLPPLAPKPGDEEGFRMKRDPMLVALPDDPRRSAMVFELGSLKEAPIMQVWLDCLLDRGGRSQEDMERFERRFGLDPLEDIERVAVSSDRLVVLQGALEKARFDEAIWDKRTYGEKGVIYEDPESGRTVGMWGDMMLMSGSFDTAEAVEDAIDRLESSDPGQRSILKDHDAYGDVYGVLSPEDLSKMLPEDQGALAEKIQSVVEHVSVHATASDDVAMVADVRGPEAQEMEDLGKSLGAALAVGRIKAQNDGDEKLVELLDHARVKPYDRAFSLDMALPFELLKTLGPCRKDRRRPDRARGEGDRARGVGGRTAD